MSDNNRGIDTSSYAGNADNAEGSIQATLDFKNARQAVPDRNLHGDGVWDASSAVSGPKELLGQNAEEGNKDAEYPSHPGPTFPGAGGTTNAGQQGIPVDFNSVAPYEYPEFPKDSYTAGAGKSAVPLT
jgi:hypothetical protein